MSIQEGKLQTRKEKKQAAKAEKKKKPLWEQILSFLTDLVIAVALLLLLQEFVAQPIRVDGTSMSNTLQNGEILLVSKIYRWTGGELNRNDIVICRYPGRVDSHITLGAALDITQHTIFVKRLVALPGDTVEIRGGQLFVNDELVPDPPAMGSTPRDYAKCTLGKDEYFVIGDNRFNSHDSRSDDVGPLKGNMIMGKAKCVLWPLNAIRGVE